MLLAMEDPMLDRVLVSWRPACMSLPHLGAGEECEEEETAERSCYGQTVTPYSLSSCASWGRGKVDYLE